jgi:hypothetical protein
VLDRCDGGRYFVAVNTELSFSIDAPSDSARQIAGSADEARTTVVFHWLATALTAM